MIRTMELWIHIALRLRVQGIMLMNCCKYVFMLCFEFRNLMSVRTYTEVFIYPNIRKKYDFWYKHFAHAARGTISCNIF